MKKFVPHKIIFCVYAYILLQQPVLHAAAVSPHSLQKSSDFDPTKELEMIASQEKIYYYQIARVGNLIKKGAYPFVPSAPDKKSACSLLFENNSLWYLLGTLSENLPDRPTLPETMITACSTILNEYSEGKLQKPAHFDFLERFKILITWGLHKNPKMIHLNSEPLFSFMIHLCSCEIQDDTLKQNLNEFIQMLEEQQLEHQQNENSYDPEASSEDEDNANDDDDDSDTVYEIADASFFTHDDAQD